MKKTDLLIALILVILLVLVDGILQQNLILLLFILYVYFSFNSFKKIEELNETIKVMNQELDNILLPTDLELKEKYEEIFEEPYDTPDSNLYRSRHSLTQEEVEKRYEILKKFANLRKHHHISRKINFD